MADEGLQSAPGGASVIMALADLYFQNGMFDQALDLAKSAIEKNPETLEAYIILAKVYKEKGDVEKSQEFAKKGLEISPENQALKSYILRKEEVEEAPQTQEETKKVTEEETIEEETIEEVQAEEKITEVKKETVVSTPKIQKPPPDIVIEREKKEPTIQDVLINITQIQGIFGALVIDETGLPIAQSLNVPLDIESTSALISIINKQARDSIGRMGIGEFKNGIIEMEKGKIFIFDTEPVVLSILTDKKVMMGLIMVKVRKAIEVIKKVLEI